MALRIYFPSNDYLSDLTGNFDALSRKFEFVRIDENIDIIEALNDNKVDLALINPYIYAQISSELDYAIVPTKCKAALGFTGIAHIYFAEFLREINTMAYTNNNQYLQLISKIVLKEKYLFEPQTTNVEDIKIDDLKKFDALLTTKKLENLKNSLDLTEEWFDTFEFPLPIAFWASSVNLDIEDISEITNLMFHSSTSDNNVYEYTEIGDTYYEREGLIANDFSEEIFNSIESTIQLFYQIGLIDNIKDVKILGSEENYSE